MSQLRSGRHFAEVLGCSESTFRELVGRSDWPVARREPPWTLMDAAKVRNWRAGFQEDRNAAAAGGGAAAGGTADAGGMRLNDLLKFERAKLLQVQRKRLEGLLVDRALLEVSLEALARLFVLKLEELQLSLPILLAGKDAGQIEKIIIERFDSMRRDLSERQTLEITGANQRLLDAAKPKPRGRPRGA
jgi:hypothetical protein